MDEQEIRKVVEEINAWLAKSKDMPWSGKLLTSLYRLTGVKDELYEAMVGGVSLHFQRDWKERLCLADFEVVYRRFPEETYNPYEG